MRIIQLQFYLLVCCGAAESFTEKSVDLGQNVTLKCEVSVKDVYWFLMKPSEPPLFILRSFRQSPGEPQYSNQTFSKRFSVQYNSSLFIHNISTNELGVYYCIQTGSPPDISSGIRLYTQNHSAVFPENQTSDSNQWQNQTSSKNEVNSHWSIPLVISGIMNCALVVAVTVLTARHCRRPPKTQAQPPDPGLQPHQDNTGPVYAEVQHTTTNGCVQTDVIQMSNLNSTYALLQLPNP
ncbi:uncharacterized protein LOC113547626 [Pangasianodon hypophthalmus]|uniref:uncharacterized protein LOC113547626 n=1 Tax=Pangasianodon hypophthalmus TaxID=310915 RepID=UPI000EFF140B|nr:uncharacterized protein LOC113547626 [Pangasianodon hypophthalmus]